MIGGQPFKQGPTSLGFLQIDVFMGLYAILNPSLPNKGLRKLNRPKMRTTLLFSHHPIIAAGYPLAIGGLVTMGITIIPIPTRVFPIIIVKNRGIPLPQSNHLPTKVLRILTSQRGRRPFQLGVFFTMVATNRQTIQGEEVTDQPGGFPVNLPKPTPVKQQLKHSLQLAQP